MKNVVLKYLAVFALLVLIGAVLMHISHRVQTAERKIARVDQKIAQEQENIRVLKAEWAYLNSPQRLERLATEGLDLKAPKSAALISNDETLSELFSIPVPPKNTKVPPDVSPLYVETSSPSIRGGSQ